MREQWYGAACKTMEQLRADYAKECAPGQALLYYYQHGDWALWCTCVCSSVEAAVQTCREMREAHGLDDPDIIFDGECVVDEDGDPVEAE